MKLHAVFSLLLGAVSTVVPTMGASHHEMIKSLDVDNDGLVTLDDFLSFFSEEEELDLAAAQDNFGRNLQTGPDCVPYLDSRDMGGLEVCVEANRPNDDMPRMDRPDLCEPATPVGDVLRAIREFAKRFGLTCVIIFIFFDFNGDGVLNQNECIILLIWIFRCTIILSIGKDPAILAALDTDGLPGLVPGEWRPRICGDPHLVLWNGIKGDYHGECDLVFLSGMLDGGEPLDVHIRTKIVTDWSYIETAVVRIGNDILEIQSGHKHLLNGVAGAELTTIGGYPAEYSKPFFTVNLGNDQEIVVKNHRMLSISINNPTAETFGDSVGLLGDFETGRKLARDGKTDLKDWNDFGQEWQVRAEKSLFSTVEGPQYPNQCKMPDPNVAKAERARRRLRGLSEASAQKACAGVDTDDFDFCVEDVLATGDVDVAGVY